jgi:DNA-binding CsgD family transcriptional regulator
MRGEFYATKALTLAVIGERQESEEFAEIASTLTRCVEARAFVACSKAIVALRAGAPASEISGLVRTVERMNMWDAFVASVRAHPPLLAAITEGTSPNPGIIAALRNAYDFDLSKRVGVDIGRRPRDKRRVGDLSPREVEVLDLICEGFTNQDIASALFISKATVKVHVGHILEKTGARSRTEIAGRGRARERRQEPE